MADKTHAILRPVRGCATDEQYIEVYDRVDSLVKALEKAAKQFDFYAEEHRKKNDAVKAETNDSMARACRDALEGNP